MVDKWQPTPTDIAGNRLPGYGVVTNIINGGLECNRPGDSRVEDRVKFYQRFAQILNVSTGEKLYCGNQRPFGLDDAVTAQELTQTSPARAASTTHVELAQATESGVRVDNQGRACADYGENLCKKWEWCRFNSDNETCEEISAVPERAQAVGTTSTEANLTEAKPIEGTLKELTEIDAEVPEPDLAEVEVVATEPEEAGLRVDKKGRTCADYGESKCNNKSWCTYDTVSENCGDKTA